MCSLIFDVKLLASVVRITDRKVVAKHSVDFTLRWKKTQNQTLTTPPSKHFSNSLCLILNMAFLNRLTNGDFVATATEEMTLKHLHNHDSNAFVANKNNNEDMCIYDDIDKYLR